MRVKRVVNDFREFAFKGNVLDMAVGVMVGGAFSKIVTSLVNDVFMPLLTSLTGKVNFSGWFIAMDGGTYPSLDAATKAGAATLNYGAFLQTVLDFVLIAACVFLMVRLIGKIRRRWQDAPPVPGGQVCPFCLMEVKAGACRCPYCTSRIKEPFANLNDNF